MYMVGAYSGIGVFYVFAFLRESKDIFLLLGGVVMPTISIAILCGGKSSRMGTDKARLLWGGAEMLDVIACKLESAGRVFLSVDRKERYAEKPWPAIEDRCTGFGPLGGLYTILLHSPTPLVFVATCDTPFVDAVLASELLSQWKLGVNAVIPRQADGRVHPLCAVYHISALPVLERQISLQKLRIRDALALMHVCYVPVEDLAGGIAKFQNLNTPEQYREVYAQKGDADEKFFIR